MAETAAEHTATKGGSFFQKHKTGVIVAVVLIGAAVAYFLFFSGGSSSGSVSTSNPGSGSVPASLVSGPPGAQGPPGARGPRGFRGRNRQHRRRHRKSRGGVMLPPVSQYGLPGPTGIYSFTRSGESAGQFAARHGTTPTMISIANPHATTFHAGQRLRVR
jgi:hypothetical protein